jgi:hypothetical protein
MISEPITAAEHAKRPRKRTRSPKRKRQFDLPETEEPEDIIIGPGRDDEGGK